MGQQRFGWVKHDGGGRPVPEGTTVKWLLDIELEGKRPYRDVSDVLNSDEYWSDVVAYKIIRDADGNIVNADVSENPVWLFRQKPEDRSYGSPLPTIALSSMVPPVTGEDIVAGAPQVNTSPIPVIAVDMLTPVLDVNDLAAGTEIDPRFPAATYGNDLMVGGYPYEAPSAAGDSHDALTFHELPKPIPVEHLEPYSNVVALPVRLMTADEREKILTADEIVSAGPRPGDGPPVGVGDIHSSAKGSGARFNAGKTEIDLIPLTTIAEFFLTTQDLTEAQAQAAMALLHLGEYQGRSRDYDALYDALAALGDPIEVMRECAQVFEYGKRKYAAWNWAKGMAWSIPFGCAGRHALFGILAGEHLDPESGKPHRGHMACNIVMLIAYADCYKEGDDRPAAGLIGPADSDIDLKAMQERMAA